MSRFFEIIRTITIAVLAIIAVIHGILIAKLAAVHKTTQGVVVLHVEQIAELRADLEKSACRCEPEGAGKLGAIGDGVRDAREVADKANKIADRVSVLLDRFEKGVTVTWRGEKLTIKLN